MKTSESLIRKKSILFGKWVFRKQCLHRSPLWFNVNKNSMLFVLMWADGLIVDNKNK